MRIGAERGGGGAGTDRNRGIIPRRISSSAGISGIVEDRSAFPAHRYHISELPLPRPAADSALSGRHAAAAAASSADSASGERPDLRARNPLHNSNPNASARPVEALRGMPNSQRARRAAISLAPNAAAREKWNAPRRSSLTSPVPQNSGKTAFLPCIWSCRQGCQRQIY
ncbi:hypothetical protein AAFF_G00434960 [Aldrovandia affinis]|uniref:Uncharacterized protein n=1 Tax=Aldrovandia affinis TaxID=143900 RepID=A0AAD7S8S4_9TELE|nr:hypothetical protein AAFF_G00434960 [Aldrovandia affinis]